MNRDVCLNCYENDVLSHKSIDRKFWSAKVFIKSWDDGSVICPHHIVFPESIIKGTWTVTKEVAFNHCPRKLEHAVAESVNIDKNNETNPAGTI